jgi:hypothetical protein
MADQLIPEVFRLRRDASGRPIPLTPRIEFDHVSDTLYIFLYGEPVPSVSVDVTNTVYAMIDPETEELIGIQTEAFTRSYVPQHPWLKPFVEILTNPSDSPYEHKPDEHRDLASYFVGSLVTEGSLTAA